jgi:hypothetical protein
MSKGKVTFAESIDKKVFDIGRLIAEGNKPGIDSFIEMKSAIEALKISALGYAEIEKQFKVSDGRREFVTIKQKEVEFSTLASKAVVAEQKAKQSLIDTERKAIDLANKKQRAQQKTIKLTEKEKLETRILNRGKREAAILSSKLSTEYEKQAVRLTQLRRRYKDVALVEGETSKNAIKLRAEILKLDSALKRVDANVGQFQRNVGNYGKAMASARNAARNLASAMGLVGGAFLVVQVIRDAIKVVRDFEKSNATLSAILQVEREDMQGLTDDAVRLGATTVKTANEVTELQIAYARLGFEQKQILELTESTISGSIAMNAELDKTANLVGAVVNTFDDLSATDAPKIIDILSLSTAKSALNFQKLETGIPIVAGAANAAGVPFTKLIALMGKLSDSGIDVSSSSTALRNIFIESAKQGLSYEQILEKIKKSQDKLTASNDEFGKRAAVSATVLANNIDKTKELDETLQNAGGTAERMANKELDTLDGAIKLLRSAWEGYILKQDEASGSSTSLKGIISGLANNLDNIFSVIGTVTKAYIAYKLAVLLARVQTSLMNLQLRTTRKSALAARFGISKASLAFAQFNKVLKANILGLIVLGVTGLIYLFDKLNKSILDTADELHKSNEEFIKQAEETQSVNTELGKMVDRYEVLKNKTKLNSKEQKELNEIVKKIAKTVPGAVTEINKYGDALEINTEKTRDYIAKQNEVSKLQAEVNIDNQRKALKELKNEQEAFNRVSEDSTGTFIKGFGVIAKTNGALVKITTQFSKTGKARFVETKLTKAQVLEYKNYQLALEQKILTAEKDIQTNEDLIASITGEKNARQLATEANEKAIKEAEALRAKKEAEIRSVENLKEKIKTLRAEQEGLTLSDKKRSVEINKLIKLYQKEIDKILGVVKANRSAAKAAKEREAKRKKLIQDSFNLESFVLKQKIKLLEEDAKNERKSFKEREQAIVKASELELDLALETAITKLLLKQDFSRQEIESLLEDGIASNELRKKLGDEELLIIQQFEAKKREIRRGSEDSIDNLTVEKLKKRAEKEKAIKEKALYDEIIKENEAFKNREGVYKNAEDAVELRERRIADIKKKYALEALNTQVKAIEKLLSTSKLSAEVRAKYEADLAKLKSEISNLTTEDFIENQDREVIKTQEKVDRIFDISYRLADALEGLGNAIFDSRIQKIDDEISANESKYEKLLENENLTEEQRETIEKKREADRKKLEKKKREEQRKQAIFGKAMAIANIGLSTAQAIIGALAPPPVGLGPLAGAALAGVAGAVGAIQLAAALASPIPKYALGTDYHPGGYALVGEKRPEVITEPNKTPYIVSDPTILNLAKGTKVTPSLEEYQRLMGVSSLIALKKENHKSREYSKKVSERKNEGRYNEKKIEEAISNGFKKQKVHFHTTANASVDLNYAYWRAKNLNRE